MFEHPTLLQGVAPRMHLACTISAAPLGVVVLKIWRGEEGVEGVSYVHTSMAMVLGILVKALLSKVWAKLKILWHKS